MNSNRVADPMSGPSRWVNSQRTDRQAPRLREIELNSLPTCRCRARRCAGPHHPLARTRRLVDVCITAFGRFNSCESYGAVLDSPASSIF